ncbi:transposase [Streptomyces sp. NPDC052236]|uniref:transposase n=1 Tax=Streptomyces sp. NPDC052236 TaxID=3365686 RepID=UPI0037D63D46
MSVGISGANLHDSQALEPLVRASRPSAHAAAADGAPRKPAKLHADKGYDYPHLWKWLRQHGIRHRIARKGIQYVLPQPKAVPSMAIAPTGELVIR